MDNVLRYVIALTNLYGLVHKEKVVEIYNLQNEEPIDLAVIDDFVADYSDHLMDEFVFVEEGYFVKEAIIQFDELEDELRQRTGKPFYVPSKEELLNFSDENYYEITQEFQKLQDYLAKNFFDGNQKSAEYLTDEIQNRCRYGFSITGIFDVFTERSIDLSSIDQVNEVLALISGLKNNTRIWENNGHTPLEIRRLTGLNPLPDTPFSIGNKDLGSPVKAVKIGRNEPCPCGSGKKYKKCCLK